MEKFGDDLELVLSKYMPIFDLLFLREGIILEKYDFAVEIVAKTQTTMHGSNEHHKFFLYCCKHAEPCDPLFQSFYNLVKGGLQSLKRFMDEQESKESC